MYLVKVNNQITNIVNTMMSDYCWSSNVVSTNNHLLASLTKSLAKKQGVHLAITQRYSKRWTWRYIGFNSESEYTMFMLKWMSQ